MKRTLRLRLQYFFIFLFLFFIELGIGLFVHDRLIRPYVGDMLVVILIYTFLRIFIPEKARYLIWYVFLFATVAETLQYLHLGRLLGLEQNRLAMVILGSTFDWKDLFCYFFGCVSVWLTERKNQAAV